MSFQSTNKLEFLSGMHITGPIFKIGTCHGQWGSTDDCYFILSIINDEPNNGHLNDVFEWFEMSCKRDNRNLFILEFFNPHFYNHVLNKRGFIRYDNQSRHLVKVFNQQKLDYVKDNGNLIIEPITKY